MSLLVKNNYYEISMLNAKKGPMKTTAQNRSANSDGSVIARGPTFSLVNALVYVRGGFHGTLFSVEHGTFIIIIFY